MAAVLYLHARHEQRLAFAWNSTNLKEFFQPLRTTVGDVNGDGKADIISVEH